jgi:hypothetical protein
VNRSELNRSEPSEGVPRPADDNALLSGGGEVGFLGSRIDWPRTRLGRVSSWSPALQTSGDGRVPDESLVGSTSGGVLGTEIVNISLTATALLNESGQAYAVFTTEREAKGVANG